MPTNTNATAKKMAHAHTATPGSLITVPSDRLIDVAFSSRDASQGHRNIQSARVQLTRPQFFLSDCHTRRI